MVDRVWSVEEDLSVEVAPSELAHKRLPTVGRRTHVFGDGASRDRPELQIGREVRGPVEVRPIAVRLVAVDDLEESLQPLACADLARGRDR